MKKWKRTGVADQSLIKQMTDAGSSTRKVAETMGISNSTVSRIVHRKNQSPSSRVSSCLCRPRKKTETVKASDPPERATPRVRKQSCSRKQLSVEQRARIMALHEESFSTRYIASRMHVAQSTVVKSVKRFKETTGNEDRPRCGRPRVTTAREDKFITITSKRKRTLTAPDIREEINGLRRKPLSVATVRRRLLNAGLKGRVAAKKPLLREANKEKRLKWAHEHVNWTASQWSKVLFICCLFVLRIF